jgi:poly(3-hydroxybutyrate) depolymerase
MKTLPLKHPFCSWLHLLVVAFILGGPGAWSAKGEDAIPSGSGSFAVGAGDKALTVFTYKPPGYHGGPLLLVFHGMTRTAENYLKYAMPLADKRKLLVVAPLFDGDHYPGKIYNYGGVKVDGKFLSREEWIYQRVPEILDAVRKREGQANLPYYMIGHSAGAQFVMRYAALMPAGAVRMVAANPGSDLFPRRDWDFGYGFGGLPGDCSNDAAMQRYLATPFTLYLGQADIDPQHPELDRSEAAEREGKFRLERGRTCFDYAKKLAEEKGWKFNWRKVEVPAIAHSGRQMLQAKEAEEALFGGP